EVDDHRLGRNRYRSRKDHVQGYDYVYQPNIGHIERHLEYLQKAFAELPQGQHEQHAIRPRQTNISIWWEAAFESLLAIASCIALIGWLLAAMSDFTSGHLFFGLFLGLSFTIVAVVAGRVAFRIRNDRRARAS
ncbi:MAG: hypothetical protein WAW96_20525, partial [Alphaproteobacteria bacterium]